MGTEERKRLWTAMLGAWLAAGTAADGSSLNQRLGGEGVRPVLPISSKPERQEHDKPAAPAVRSDKAEG